uniref:Centrosomal protein 192 n=1 Tax=Astyanax mexicanus TaxID=7994 RepID=A0A8B9KPY7_ASTMX
MDSFRNLEDETFPSFLYNTSLGGSGCATLGNVTLGSTLGVPMAASTVAKIRATADNRWETPICGLTSLYTVLCVCFQISDDDIDINHLPDEELKLYFSKLVPPSMQRGRVEGQEIPAAVSFFFLFVFCLTLTLSNDNWWSLICIFTSVFNADAGHSVVYQNEEGKWVTDLAYYSSFEKEVGTDVQENISVQSEDFVGGNQAMEKIIEDQNEFEKEHQFIQEEKIEAANASMVLKDTSWKVPSSSHILMRASQASTEFEKGNQSYLRISLGEFFQQRSEALGCLGSSEEDFVKRPSFGYVINSPEKREPFALLRPSDFCSRGNSVHSETVQLSDADETMNPEDLEKTSMSSSNSGSSLSLSISTIASAIADASISSDPAQLAAMIMELSKKSRSRSSQQTGLSTQLSGAKMLPGQSNIQDALQKTSSLVDLSLDMEKYLKKAELSSSDSDASSSQSCLDILSLADSLTRSQRLEQRQSPPLQNETSAHTDCFCLLLLISLFVFKASPERTGCRVVDPSHCSFRPSTSPLTHSSPSQTSLPTQVVVPDELKFPNSCCVGIACQTSLSIFNPSERWQQVAISIVNLSIDGHKVDSLPYQWLIVKNKTIIGPKSTEEQKVLLIAPKAGLYQCTLSVSSWPASAESETVAQAEVFAKKVVLVAVAENPAIEVDVGKTGCLDFGDLAGGSVKALPLKLVNRTRATVPIRLVISANASAWHCFSFSKSPVAMTPDGTQLSGANLMPVSAPSVINHVMHSSYGDNPDSFMVWVHFNAPQRKKKISLRSELGQPDEYSARVDIEVDSPGPSHVIQSVALKARSGTARVHAPKDLQVRHFSLNGVKQNLPLKNAGNIDVQLRLKCNDGDDCFIVKPEEFFLRTGEEKSVVVAYTAQGSRKFSESVLTILVLPSGPQYEVVLKGEVIQGNSAKVSSTLGSVPHSEVPPILSNKQFMAWGGVTLGRAVQQKLVLRNNSPTASQQLRLLIRGQDQDCFQLQSSFGPDERLTRNRELLIKPKEDMTVHLLFAPTRVASMLAKLEIKQSALRPSQPGVKFTIPLSGYGGTSNVILEELRKRSDGYVATLSGIQAGHVSKLCVCVRNTGSRAAFVRAVPYSDLEKRTVMESTVISLSPSQFVLKERTQEVRLLLSIKPDAGKKVLSENSLLRNISFDEPFLGEELVQESHDLPQRPNEGQIFYGNMSKVMLSLFGTVEMSDSGESDLVEFVRPSQHHALNSDSGLGTSERQFSNVSLDVLPVKGPPLCISEPVLKRTEPPVDNTWGIQPEQLVLAAPTISEYGAADTRHVQIINRSSRELSFELSWPAHCLTITPQHGVIESHLQILISPNPSLATRTSMLPWNGQIYVQCDNQQKFIRVQIRQDLALDVSAAGPPSEQSLCPLPPQAETPTGPGLKAQISSPQHQVLIKDRTLVFPSTLSGESSECSLEMENSGEEVRWYLSSFAPPYVKGVDGSGDVYRATYSAFRCERVSGMLGVPFTFLPRDGGDYAQFWDLECHPVSKPQHKSCIRFQLCGTVNYCKDKVPHIVIINKKCVILYGTPLPSRRGVYVPQSLYTFPATRVGEVSTLKVNFRNNSSSTHELRFLSPTEPFYIKHSKYSLRTQHYINLPVQFKPAAVGQFSGMLHVQTDTDVKLSVELAGEALP